MAKTLLELFKGSPQDIDPRVVDKTPLSDDETKQLDQQGLYFDNNLYKYGTNYSKIKSDKETLIEQETTGIRIRSAVELNNPLIYGNEAIRIVNRTTSTLDTMKSATGGEPGDGGLIGKGLSKLTGGKVSSISQARDAVNSKLGIPSTMNPSRLNSDIIKIVSSEPITKDNVGQSLQGTGLGNFLKDTGGGNPKTLGKQALGNGIGKAKDLLRNKLFGSGGTIGEAVGEKIQTEYNNTNPYTKVLKDNRDYKSEGGDAKEFTGIDLSLVSPVFGTKRKSDTNTLGGRFGTSEYAFEDTRAGYRQINPYEPDRTYTTEAGSPTPINEGSLSKRYGMGKSDDINLLQTTDYDTIDDFGVYKKGETKVGEDLIPFNIGKFGEKRTPFRAILTGISETVSPSWSTNKMVGNPFPFYTFTQIERNVSFNLKIACLSPLELATNWEKIEALTKMAYPKINQNNLVTPPIIQFRLGDIYYDKIGFVESLTYTVPDNGVWETDGTLGFLPKFVEVAITIKFIEDSSVINSLYGYKKSKAAIEKINEENNSAGFDENSVTQRANTAGSIGDRFGIEKAAPIKVNTRGIAPPNPLDISGAKLPGNISKKPKSLISKLVPTTTPIQADTGFDDLKKSQSAVVDKLDGRTPIEEIKNLETTNGLTPGQSRMIASLKGSNDKVTFITRNDLEPDIAETTRTDGVWTNSKFVKFEHEFGISTKQIASDGNIINLQYKRK